MSEPLDIYSDVQPLVQKEIEVSMQKFTSERKYDVAQIPAHVHTGIDSNQVDFTDLTNRTRYVYCRLVGPVITTTTGTTVGGDFVMPFNGYVTAVGATVDTAGTTGVMTINFLKNGTTILLTKVTIDSTEKTSRTAATPSVLDSSKVNFLKGDIFTFNVDGVQTTPATGLTVFINVVEVK